MIAYIAKKWSPTMKMHIFKINGKTTLCGLHRGGRFIYGDTHENEKIKELLETDFICKKCLKLKEAPCAATSEKT